MTTSEQPSLPAIRNDLAPDEPMTLRQRLLAALALRPYESDQKLAADLGCSPYTIRILTSSDEFKLALSERYTVGQIRAKARATEVAVNALEALSRLLSENAEVPHAVRLEAARVVLAHSERLTSPAAAAGPSMSVNVSITQDDLSRARDRALTHARGLTIENSPQPVAPQLTAVDEALKDLSDVPSMGQHGLSFGGSAL